MSGYTNQGEVFWGNENDQQLQNMYYEDYNRFEKQQLGNKYLRFTVTFASTHTIF